MKEGIQRSLGSHFGAATRGSTLFIALVVVFFVVAFVALTVVGIVRYYSPVPIGDYWEGYLGFYADLREGNYWAWVSQFTEHRPVLPRVLYWLDIQYFGGRSVFLIFANLLMLSGVVVVLVAYLRRVADRNAPRILVAATICIIAVSWLQRPNLSSGFYGAQWFMIMLVALLAFYWLARARERPRYFLLALLAGFASAWTMANGILVLPVLVVLAVCIGLQPMRVAVLAIAAVAAIALYFVGYVQPQIHGEPWAAVTGDQIGTLQYMLGYLGSPFFHIVSFSLAGLQHVFQFGGKSTEAFGLIRDYPMAFAIGLYAAQAAGAVLIALSLVLTWRWFVSGREATRGALIAFLLFIGISAAGTAAGRMVFGTGSSIELRYTTPALLGWAALIVLGSPSYDLRRALSIFVLAVCLLLPSQFFGLRSLAALHEQNLRAMRAVTNGSDDPEIFRQLGAPVEAKNTVRRLRGSKILDF